jgi:hypothetical protein
MRTQRRCAGTSWFSAWERLYPRGYEASVVVRLRNGAASDEARQVFGAFLCVFCLSSPADTGAVGDVVVSSASGIAPTSVPSCDPQRASRPHATAERASLAHGRNARGQPRNASIRGDTRSASWGQAHSG